MQEIQELKQLFTKLADDKVTSEELQREEQELKDKKKFIQDLNS